MNLSETALAFWQEPTREHFLTLQESILAQPNYTPDLSAPVLAGAALEQADYAAVVNTLRPHLPGALLSPSFHTMLAYAYDQLGDADAAKRDAQFAQAALDGIKLTGDGSREAPWRVLRIQDEYDLLADLGRRSVVQRLFNEDGLVLDQHECDDGTQLWFDVSLFFNLAAQR